MTLPFIFSLILISSLPQSFASDGFEFEDDRRLWPVLGNLQGKADYIVDRVVNNIFTEDEEKQEILEFIESEVENEQYISCLECRTLVSLLLGLANSGRSFEEVRDEVVDLCIELVRIDDEDTNGEILCPGVVDIQGPHVYNILNTTEYSALELCTLYNICEDDRDRTPYTYTPIKHGKSVNEDRKRNRRENTIKVLTLADIHIDEAYFTGAATDCGLPACCKDYYNGTGVAGEWGDYKCNIPPRTFTQMMESMALLEPDFILYAGDSPPHTVWNETMESQLSVSRFVSEAITSAMPGVPAYPAIGNHETYPTNFFYPPLEETQYFVAEFTKLWEEAAGFGDEQIESMNENGHFSIVQRPGLRIISYNTNYGYTMNLYNILSLGGEWYENMQNFLLTELENARQNDEKVLLLGHHPSGHDNTFISWGRWMTDVLVEYGDIIAIHLLGHHHNDFWRLVIDEESGIARAVQITNPSSGSKTDKNPSARLFFLDEDTYEPIDFENYHLDLSEAMVSGKAPEMKFVYSASEEYGMADVTARSFQILTDSFEDEDLDLFGKYRINYNTRTSEPSECSGSCLQKELCRLRTSSWDRYRDCLAAVPLEDKE